MSVFITIREAELKTKPVNDTYALIQSSSQITLKTQSSSTTSEKLGWQASFISSIKQKQLKISISQSEKLSLEDQLASGQLDFSAFEYCPERQIQYRLPMMKDEKNVGFMDLAIFYTEKKRFIGEIDFYHSDGTKIRSILRLPNIEGTQMPKQRVIFYKGPCKNKNFFSCCDHDLTSQKQYQVVEHVYRDKYY